MVITTKIKLNDYLKLAFYLTYSKPVIIFIYVSVVAFIVYSFATKTDDFITGLMIFYLLFIPLLTYFRSRKVFMSNKKLQDTVEYEFADGKITAKGKSFSSEFNLNDSYKVRETGKWFLVYHSSMVANMIPKTNMTASEISSLRSIFKSLPGVKLKLQD